MNQKFRQRFFMNEAPLDESSSMYAPHMNHKIYLHDVFGRNFFTKIWWHRQIRSDSQFTICLTIKSVNGEKKTFVSTHPPWIFFPFSPSISQSIATFCCLTNTRSLVDDSREQFRTFESSEISRVSGEAKKKENISAICRHFKFLTRELNTFFYDEV